MTKASDNDFPSILVTEQGSAPSNPAASHQRIYIRTSDHTLVTVNSSGTVTPVGGSGSGVATDPIWDAVGDLAVGSGADTAARLAIGATNGMALRRVSGAVAWDLPPGHEFTYDEFTSPVNITATTEGGADTVKASSAITYDGTSVVYIEFFAAYVQCPAGNNSIVFVLLEDTTVLGIAIETADDAGAANQRQAGVMIRRRRTPSNASHTYTMKAYVNSGTGVVGVGAGGSGAYLPGYIRVCKA